MEGRGRKGEVKQVGHTHRRSAKIGKHRGKRGKLVDLGEVPAKHTAHKRPSLTQMRGMPKRIQGPSEKVNTAPMPNANTMALGVGVGVWCDAGVGWSGWGGHEHRCQVHMAPFSSWGWLGGQMVDECRNAV